MGILTWILVGLVAGFIAKALMPGKDPGGFIVTILIGIAGGLLGGFLSAKVLNWGAVDGFNLTSIALAVGGSVLLLLIYRMLKR